MLEAEFVEYAAKRTSSVGPDEPASWYLRCRVGRDKSRAVSGGEHGRDLPPNSTEEDVQKLVNELVELNLERESIHIELVGGKGTRAVAGCRFDPEDGHTSAATKDDFMGAFIETMRIQRLTINDRDMQLNKAYQLLLKAAHEQGVVAGFMLAGEHDAPRVDPVMAREAIGMVREIFGGQVKTPRDALKKMDDLVTKLAEAKKAGGVDLTDDEKRQGAALVERVINLVHGDGATDEPEGAKKSASGGGA